MKTSDNFNTTLKLQLGMPFHQLHILSYEIQEEKKPVEYVAVIDFVNYFKLRIVIMRKSKSLFIIGEKM